MSATQVLRVRSGDTITVRTGILRGAGPAGPEGPPGPRGAQGDTGPTGPTGTVDPIRARLVSTASTATSDDHWYPLAFETLAHNDEVLVDTLGEPYDPYQFSFVEEGQYLIITSVQFEEHGSGVASTGARRLQLVDQAGSVYDQKDVDAVPFGRTTMLMVSTLLPRTDFSYSFKAQSSDIAGISVTSRVSVILRVGAGPAGPAGPPGPVGDTGPVGPTGPTGSAGTGYATFDDLKTGGVSGTAPTAGAATADQLLPYPTGGQTPAIPGFLHGFASAIERRLVGHFTSLADWTAKRGSATTPGDIFYVEDIGAYYVAEDDGTNSWLTRSKVSTSAPPSGAGVAARGTIWMQVD